MDVYWASSELLLGVYWAPTSAVLFGALLARRYRIRYEDTYTAGTRLATSGVSPACCFVARFLDLMTSVLFTLRHGDGRAGVGRGECLGAGVGGGFGGGGGEDRCA